MLIEFSVENHRAIRERQTFSMVADEADVLDRLEPPYHAVGTGLASVPRILVDACLFGANGAGKTSLVDAMAFMVDFVRTSVSGGPHVEIGVEPFILHSQWREQPSEFEVIFVHAKTIYRYGFVATREKVIEEWLFVGNDKTDRWRRIFEREYISKDDRYDWKTTGIKVGRILRSWKSQTRPNTLFLSASVRFNAGGDLKNAYEWITTQFRTFSISDDGVGLGYTAGRFGENGWSERVRNFFGEFGVGLSDIVVKKIAMQEVPGFSSLPDPLEDVFGGRASGGKIPLVIFQRDDEKGAPVAFDLSRESNGIKALFSLAGPILDALDKGSTIVVDELNLGLHPFAIENLLGMFCDKRTNAKRAQIIFTTHSPAIVAVAILDRDQIWIVEKEENTLGARFEQLPNFNDSEIKNFSRDYLGGCFGGVPETKRQL